jgi:thymidylate synthase
LNYETPRDAFVSELAKLLAEGHLAKPITDRDSPASSFGANPQPSIEILGSSFQVRDVRRNLISLPQRPFNLEYGVGLLLWTLVGSDDPNWIEYYRGKRATQKRAAFGARLFQNGGGINQCKVALQRIAQDEGTRRTYMPILSVEDHVDPQGEIPCAAGFQIFLRNSSLHGVTVMRAQNASNSLPMDIFIFSSLLQFLAASIGVSVGTYSHLSTTFHIFEADRLAACEVVDQPSSVVGLSLGDPQGLPAELGRLMDFEGQLRSYVLEQNHHAIDKLAQTHISLRSELGHCLQKLFLAVAFKKTDQQDRIQSLDLPSEIRNLLETSITRSAI